MVGIIAAGPACELFGLQADAVAGYLAARREAPEVVRRFDAVRATARQLEPNRRP